MTLDEKTSRFIELETSEQAKGKELVDYLESKNYQYSKMNKILHKLVEAT